MNPQQAVLDSRSLESRWLDGPVNGSSAVSRTDAGPVEARRRAGFTLPSLDHRAPIPRRARGICLCASGKHGKVQTRCSPISLVVHARGLVVHSCLRGSPSSPVVQFLFRFDTLGDYPRGLPCDRKSADFHSENALELEPPNALAKILAAGPGQRLLVARDSGGLIGTRPELVFFETRLVQPGGLPALAGIVAVVWRCGCVSVETSRRPKVAAACGRTLSWNSDARAGSGTDTLRQDGFCSATRAHRLACLHGQCRSPLSGAVAGYHAIPAKRNHGGSENLALGVTMI